MKIVSSILLALALLTIPASLSAHQGHEHKILGTVKALHENQLVVEKRDGTEKTVTLTADSKLVRDGKPADRAALRTGLRVSVEVNNDDQVLTVTLGKE